MTSHGVRGESLISGPDNIETKTAISSGGDGDTEVPLSPTPPHTITPSHHYYAPTTIMAPLNINWCEKFWENTKNCHTM